MRFSFTPKDIVRLIRTRLFWFAIPFALLGILGLIAISQIPPMYESRAELLVEGQQVPDAIVQSTIQTEALARLSSVRAQVMARDNLIRLGERHGVFAGQRMSRTEKDELMKERTRIAVRAQEDGRPGRRGDTVVTATLSFTDDDPLRAQRVANDLLSQFQSRNVEMRRDQASGASDFIQEEERKVRRELQRIGQEIARIKEENPDALPDNRSFYESTLQRLLIERDRTQADVASTETAIQQLQMERPRYTVGDLSPREQELADLRSALSRARLKYQDTYPDVIALKEQILDLEREVDPAAFRENARTEIAAQERALAGMRKGTPDHGATEARIAELRGQLRDLPAGAQAVSPGEASFNGQVFALQSRLDALALQQENLDRQVADMEARIASVPQVESQLYDLQEEQARLERDLAEVQSDRAMAQRSESLEAQAKAERLVTLEQPVAPDEPTSPNKPKLAVAIFALAAGLAGLVVLVPEVLFAKVQSKDHLSELLPDVPVVEVPRFKTADERLPKLIATASLSTATLVLGVALSWTAFQTLT